MSWRTYGLACASVFAMVFAGGAQAAEQAAPAPAAAPEAATLGEIVVTARRRTEALQEVPQVVNAVTTDSLQKLNITQFEDVQRLVPGLSLSDTNGAAIASLRGVNFDALVGNPDPTVAFYMNDAPVQAGHLFSSLFDIGQVEVLRGPQGTTRGISAPSGAITMTTRRPDLSAFGGYVSGLTTDVQSRNLQAAVNLPIIKDILAVRVAGVFDDNRLNFVSSLHSATRPELKTGAERITVSFEPSDRFNATLMYQHTDIRRVEWTQEAGPGPGPAPASLPGALNTSAVNPPLSAGDRAAVDDAPLRNNEHFDEITAQLDSRLFGQHLSYVGSYSRLSGPTYQPEDYGNVLPGFPATQTVDTTEIDTTHEIRISSDPAPDRFIDYTVGGFYKWEHVDSFVNTPVFFFSGAFGPPGTYVPTAFNPRYALFSNFAIGISKQETSLFGNLTLHFGPNTELSGGIRHIWSQLSVSPSPSLSSPFTAIPASLLGGACIPGIAGPSVYAGFCDFPLSIPGLVIPPTHFSGTPNIYTVSLSHHFTRDFLAYVNTGTSFRTPFNTIGLQGVINTDPATNDLVNHPAETSRTYEVGFKSTWLDDRVRLNVAAFRQRFHNLALEFLGIRYVTDLTTGAFTVSNNMSASVDALVQGFDIDAAAQITRDWSVSLQASYADSHVEGSKVLCNTVDATGKPTFNTAGIVSLCPGGGPASHLPLWNASLQSEYVHPVRDGADGFLRGLVTYYPENKRLEPGFPIGKYAIANLYAGVRSEDGAWEVALFARNVFNTQQILDQFQAQESPVFQTQGYSVNPNTGYFRTTMTHPREVGVSFRYAWGSR